MMKNRIKQSCIAFSIVTVLLAGCSATGETYTDKFAEGEHQEDTTIVDHAVALAVEKIVGSYLPGEQQPNEIEEFSGYLSELLNGTQELESTLDKFVRSIGPFFSSSNQSQQYFNVSYRNNYDGDTVTLVVNSAYEIGFEESEAGEVGQPSMRELEAHDSLLQVNQEITIRALLVNCSELRDKNGQTEPYSQEAQEYVQHLLQNADSIVAAYDRGPKQDHYSRELMYLWADGRLVQQLLLEKGLAKIAYITEPNTTYLEQLQIAEEKAKSAGLNLWSIN